MTPIEKLANAYRRVNESEKKIKDQKEELRKEILEEINLLDNDTISPTIIVEIPTSFFKETNYIIEDFISSRYPGFKLVGQRGEEDKVTFILEQDSNLVNKVIESNSTILTKSVVEYSPEIDGDTLQKELPSLYEILAQEEVSIVLNDEALQNEIQKDPEILAKLRRHMKVREPSIRLTPRKKNND